MIFQESDYSRWSEERSHRSWARALWGCSYKRRPRAGAQRLRRGTPANGETHALSNGISYYLGHLWSATARIVEASRRSRSQPIWRPPPTRTFHARERSERSNEATEGRADRRGAKRGRARDPRSRG